MDAPYYRQNSHDMPSDIPLHRLGQPQSEGYSTHFPPTSRKTPAYTVSNTKESDALFVKSSGKGNDAWKPGAWKRFPVVAIASLLGSFACTIAAIIVLLKSDGDPISTWTIEPSIYLAITSVIANTLLGVALSDGLTISFWRRSLVPAPISALHWYYEAGSGSYGALKALFHGSGKMNAVACLAVTIALARGPLNQKASFVQENVVFSTNGTTTAHLSQTLPSNYTGLQRITRATGYYTAMLTPDFSNITNAYSIRAPINTTYTECGERCFVQIPGFGFDVNCTKVESDLDFGTTPDANGSLTAKETDAFTSNVILGYDITGSGNQGYTNARIQLFTSTTPDGKILRNNTCHMYASLVAYDVQLAEGEATLRSSDYRTDRVISRITQETPQLLGGFALAAQNMFQSTATYSFSGAVSSWSFTGSLANRYLAGLNATDQSSPRMAWNDPMEDMISAVREIGFRTAVAEAASDSTAANSTQSVSFTGTDVRTLYGVRKAYMVVAALLGIISGLVVAVTLRGWWLLGRSVSMSPLELANAFDAPLMRQMSDNADIDNLLDGVQRMQVIYGDQATVPGISTDSPSTSSSRRIFSQLR